MRVLIAFFALVAVSAFAGCGGGDGGPAAEPKPKPAQVEPGDPARGKQVYLEAGCGNCHVFEAAGSTRNVAPNLDAVVAKYDEAFVRESIVNPNAFIEKGAGGTIGKGAPYRASMPAYGPNADLAENKLSAQEIEDLVEFLMSAKK